MRRIETESYISAFYTLHVLMSPILTSLELADKFVVDRIRRVETKQYIYEGQVDSHGIPHGQVSHGTRVNGSCHTCEGLIEHRQVNRYGVASISRLLEIIGLFCKRAL